MFTHHLYIAGPTVRGQPDCTLAQKWFVTLTQPCFLDNCLETPLRSLVLAGVCYICSFDLHVVTHFLSWPWSELSHHRLTDMFTSPLVSSVYQFLGDFRVLSLGMYISILHTLLFGDCSSILFCRSLGSPFRQACAEVFLWQEQCCWGADCDWERQNVRGRKEEERLLCSWRTGPQILLHSWQESCELHPECLCPSCSALHSQEQLLLQCLVPVVTLALMQVMQSRSTCFPGYTSILEIGSKIWGKP